MAQNTPLQENENKTCQPRFLLHYLDIFISRWTQINIARNRTCSARNLSNDSSRSFDVYHNLSDTEHIRISLLKYMPINGNGVFVLLSCCVFTSINLIFTSG
jgi:hypothetical protein